MHQTHNEKFKKRLRELAVHTHRNLIHMWVNLQRERVEKPNKGQQSSLYRANSDDSLNQSLEVLGELLVRPLISEQIPEASTPDVVEPGFVEDSRDGGLPDAASEFLRRLVIAEHSPDNEVQHVLNARQIGRA